MRVCSYGDGRKTQQSYKEGYPGERGTNTNALAQPGWWGNITFSSSMGPWLLLFTSSAWLSCVTLVRTTTRRRSLISSTQTEKRFVTIAIHYFRWGCWYDFHQVVFGVVDSCRVLKDDTQSSYMVPYLLVTIYVTIFMVTNSCRCSYNLKFVQIHLIPEIPMWFVKTCRNQFW